MASVGHDQSCGSSSSSFLLFLLALRTPKYFARFGNWMDDDGSTVESGSLISRGSIRSYYFCLMCISTVLIDNRRQRRWLVDDAILYKSRRDIALGQKRTYLIQRCNAILKMDGNLDGNIQSHDYFFWYLF